MDSIQQPCSSTNQCSICTQEAHGIHFGVYSCRACAAFFRRCIVLKRSYKCRQFNGNCKVDKNDRFVCRACRLEKCISVGMTEDNVQFNRGRVPSEAPNTSSTSQDQNSQCSGNLANQQTVIQHAKKSCPVIEEKPKFPPTTLVQLYEIFAEKQPSQIETQSEPSELTKMTAALEKMRADQTDEMQIVSVMDFSIAFKDWEKELLRWAHWMECCPEFKELDFNIKMAMYSRSWCCLMRMERLAMTVDILGEQVITRRIVCAFDRYAIDEHTKFIAMNCPEVDGEKVRRIFVPSFDRMINDICRPFLELDISIEELTFLLLQIMWHVEGSSFEEYTLEIADKVRNRLSLELHEYYQKTKKTKNYADRLINIMGIVREGEKIQNERNKVFELARLFDFFDKDSY